MRRAGPAACETAPERMPPAIVKFRRRDPAGSARMITIRPADPMNERISAVTSRTSYFASAMRRLSRPKAASRSGSSARLRMAWASRSLSRTGTMIPLTPSTTVSPAARGIGRDDGPAHGHGLQHGARGALSVGGEDEDVGRGEGRADVLERAQVLHRALLGQLRHLVGAQRVRVAVDGTQDAEASGNARPAERTARRHELVDPPCPGAGGPRTGRSRGPGAAAPHRSGPGPPRSR